MVVQRRGAFVEAARVPGVGKSEALEVQMVTKLVAKRAEERSEGGDRLANRCSHPDADEHGVWMIVAEKLRG